MNVYPSCFLNIKFLKKEKIIPKLKVFQMYFVHTQKGVTGNYLKFEWFACER